MQTIASAAQNLGAALEATSHQRTDRWKVRGGPAGLHLFNRATGINVLLDEVPVPVSLHARAPRQISIALTNRCDLACAHCYAPKSRARLSFDAVTGWLAELDFHGTLGVGFGGGEPTLHPEFSRLCQHVARKTGLAVSFTTHGHHLDETFVEEVSGSVDFIRVSMDGVDATYESIRRRSFTTLLAKLKFVQTIARFGINVVVNERTLPDLSMAATMAADAGACELLLLPQMATHGVEAIRADTLQELRDWVNAYRGPLKLCINEACAEGFPTCDPLIQERGLRAYAHIDATGMLKPSSYATTGVLLGESGVMNALNRLTQNPSENDT